MGDLSQNFSKHEFACQCGCNADNINSNLVAKLQVFRDTLERSVVITSGLRCVEHNSVVGGVPHSQHVTGNAADVVTLNSADRGDKLIAALSAGFKAIGIGKNFLHLDTREFDGATVVFDYYGSDHVA
tara:strand:- start:6313 stop:6696 length:384 start_codon:yes stop_codon:yes gene_type:complete